MTPAHDPDVGRTRIERHRQVKYRLIDHGLRREGFTVSPADDGRRIDVVGLCPGCGGHISFSWEYGLPGYKGIFSRRGERAETERTPDKSAGNGTSGPVLARTVCCDCGHVHAERPADSWDQGCGAYWQVRLP
ncbi:hypothetical protein ACOZ38_13725 [Sphaerisporangium viridialbum]|uniref:hypothetical protein n=1 Tax=Sphaerisporangium viridialbum TaxID=46189 RepID=UPI003C707DDF